jgi:hypothetical protein
MVHSKHPREQRRIQEIHLLYGVAPTTKNITLSLANAATVLNRLQQIKH